MDIKSTLHLAVVGFGPRGLGAIEALATQPELEAHHVQIDIFDPGEWPGAGPNYDPDQSEHCILNIPVRSVNIDPPDGISAHIRPFPDWSKNAYHPEDFPPRSDLGAYFNARFEALHAATDGRFTIIHHRTQVETLTGSNGAWRLLTTIGQFGPFSEVLLTQGQPLTEPDNQLKRWKRHAVDHNLELIDAYPANDLLTAAQGWAGKTVAVRGLGLSTFDVVRMLTTGMGGEFCNGTYRPSGNEPRAILPFSLTGLPPEPKPATRQIDARFDPTEQETRRFQDALNRTATQTAEAALLSICDAMVAPAVRITSTFSTSVTDDEVRHWLAIERDNPGGQDNRDTMEALTSHIEMAHGRKPPSVGYTIGQLWRKWHDAIRDGFNPVPLPADVAVALVNFGEGLKRISSGPPVSASEEMLILIKQGLIRVSVVDDPDIELKDTGWSLSDDDENSLAPVMINAVLPTPDLATVRDPLVMSCVSHGRMRAMAEGLGAEIAADGELSGAANGGLCMLGRLTLGSVIVVDSVHDCFGDTAKRWAKGVVARVLT